MVFIDWLLLCDTVKTTLWSMAKSLSLEIKYDKQASVTE